MVGRAWWSVLLVAVASTLGACGGDGGTEVGAAEGTASTATWDPRVDDGGGDDRTWSSGQATLELDGERWTFALDFCATQPVDPAADTTTITLQVDGAAVDDPSTTLQIIESATAEPEQRIQVARVRFEGADGGPGPAWEAQRVVDVATGEVSDLHGDGTTPLLDVDEGDELVVTASGAAFWQFGMATTEDAAVGTGELRARCQR